MLQVLRIWGQSERGKSFIKKKWKYIQRNIIFLLRSVGWVLIEPKLLLQLTTRRLDGHTDGQINLLSPLRAPKTKNLEIETLFVVNFCH